MSKRLRARHAAAAILLATCALAYAATATPVMKMIPAPQPAPSVFMTSTDTGPAPAATTTPVASTAVAAATPRPLAGVNISGGEFGSGTPRYGYSYAYPTRAEIDYFAANGAEIIRIPFKWERLQPALYGPLSAIDRAALKAATNYAVQKGLTVVLDMHNYGARNLPTGSALVGSALVAEPALADAWVKIADDYRAEPKVWLGLMNEPNKQTPADWWRTAQQLTSDLRGQRIVNRLIVPGTKWSGAHSWISSGNAAEAAKYVDPDNNTAFDVHQYLDADSSGTSPTCKAGAARRIDAVLGWASARNVKLFFGEIGASGDAQCAIEYPAMLAKLNASAAVVGWTAWGGGKWWNDAYMFKLSPVGGQTTPHMVLVQNAMLTRG